MVVRIRLFGPQAQIAGCDELAIELGLGKMPTCAELRRRIAEAEPALAPSLPSSRFAVNQIYADDTRRITPDDEVALIGLISGG